MNEIEFVQVRVPRYGWLGKIIEGGKEIYRGEFQATPAESLQKSIEWLEEKEQG